MNYILCLAASLALLSSCTCTYYERDARAIEIALLRALDADMPYIEISVMPQSGEEDAA